MVGDEDLVAAVEVETIERRGDPGRCVRHEDQAVSVGTDEGGESTAGCIEERLVVPGEETYRIALELVPELCLQVEHSTRRGAEGAVVAERDIGIERPLVTP